MKKILLFASALAGLFLAGSCQRESLEPMKSANTVTYIVTVPDALATKGIGDEVSNVNTLHYEVYRTAAAETVTFTDADRLLYHKHATAQSDGTFKIDLELVNDQNFTVLFWAQVGETNEAYDVDDLTAVTIKTPIKANQVDYAAFSGVDFIQGTDALTDKTIKLTRPVAQINLGTTKASLEEAFYTDITVSKSSMTVVGLSNTFNVAKQAASGELKSTTVYDEKTVPTTDPLTVNSTDYVYVGMNYAGFAHEDGTPVTVSYGINTSEGLIQNTIENVPVKPNYRTNIVGNLITSKTAYTIELDEEWEGAYVGPEFVEVPAYDETTKTWTVTNADELAWVAASVNGTIGLQTKTAASCKTFKGETIVLANDIDLQNQPWTPIGYVENASCYDYLFAGIFDGKGYAIKNLNVNGTDRAGLFGNMCGATVRNLTIDGFELKSPHYAGAIVGWAEQGGSPIVVENCKVLNGTITVNVVEIEGGRHDLGDKAGAVVGFAHHGEYLNNVVENVIINGYRDIAGVVGYGNNTVAKGNQITNVTLIQNLECDYKKDEEGGSTPTTLDKYIGRKGGSCQFEGNTGEVTKMKHIADGIYAPVPENENDPDIEYFIYESEGLEWVAGQVDEELVTFEGKTLVLVTDLDFTGNEWNPIGDNRIDGAAFSGTFDGQNHTIKGTNKSSFDGSNYGSKEGWGLFSVTDGATIKNLKVDEATFASYTVISGTIAGYANNTTFENIEISNTKISGYNWYTGGVVGWAQGECTFKGVNLDETVAVGTLWDSHGQNAGGIAGGVSASAKITIEDCNIACVLDVINDVTSNYKWYIYRVAGMIIGNTNTTETKYNEVVTATATNVTCKNVTVTYGDWMNYHYCQGYWNRGWGRYESSDYVGGVDQDEPHNHPDGESHYVCIPFDQLFGGSSNGSGHYPVKGLRKFEGVSVHYPSSYVYVEETVVADEVSEITGGATKGVIDEGYLINMTTDITASANDTDAASGYNGATGVRVNGGVLDGNNHTLTINDANTTWSCAVSVTGGTIKNLTVAGAFRGIFMSGASADVYIDNVTFDGVVYTFNSDAGNKNFGVYISNSTLNGWTSHSDVHKEVVYTNCTFCEGNGYAFCRPYGPTTFNGCDFAEGFEIDPRGKVQFENCTFAGAPLTAENLAELVTSNIANATVK